MQPARLLSQSLSLGPLTVPNRIVMPPLVIWRADESGTVTDEHLDHYARSAGPGLVIAEATTVDPAGRLAATQLGVWTDDQIEGLTRLATTIHASGALAGIQIHHAGGSTRLASTYGAAPRVPTLLDSSPEGATELTEGEVSQLVEAFRLGVRRALAAGFDVIELHGAHRYLISQFLSPETNRREDRWGGSPEKRRAFLLAVIEAARGEIKAAGRERSAALTVRLGLAASHPNALPLEEGLAAARAAVEAGVDLLDISNGGAIDEEDGARIAEFTSTLRDALELSVPGWEPPPTLLLAGAAKLSVGVPVIGVNGVKRPEEAAAVIESGVADMVAVGRGILADPGWARKALGEERREIQLCEECRPRCFWFKQPPKCPARRKLAARGEQPPVEYPEQ
ncbi:MAG: hypothetical protein ACOC1U_06435 [Spirochaetota bacterium]